MLEGLEPRVRLRPCAVRTVLEGLEESDQQILKDALADVGRWTNNGLAVSLTERGVSISEGPIRKHRLKMCTCR